MTDLAIILYVISCCVYGMTFILKAHRPTQLSLRLATHLSTCSLKIYISTQAIAQFPFSLTETKSYSDFVRIFCIKIIYIYFRIYTHTHTLMFTNSLTSVAVYFLKFIPTFEKVTINFMEYNHNTPLFM